MVVAESNLCSKEEVMALVSKCLIEASEETLRRHVVNCVVQMLEIINTDNNLKNFDAMNANAHMTDEQESSRARSTRNSPQKSTKPIQQ